MKAWELLSDKTKWTTGAFARNDKGQDVHPQSPEATCWCAIGAISYSYDFDRVKKERVRQILADSEPVQRFGGHVPDWNDAATHEEVVNLLRILDI